MKGLAGFLGVLALLATSVLSLYGCSLEDIPVYGYAVDVFEDLADIGRGNPCHPEYEGTEECLYDLMVDVADLEAYKGMWLHIRVRDERTLEKLRHAESRIINEPIEYIFRKDGRSRHPIQYRVDVWIDANRNGVCDLSPPDPGWSEVFPKDAGRWVIDKNTPLTDACFDPSRP